MEGKGEKPSVCVSERKKIIAQLHPPSPLQHKIDDV